jgi:2,4-dienoyl-CoA reductase-like NADH-dependent reductase (Old Yellow Enzyme family)
VAFQQILHAGRYGGIDLGYCVQPSVVPQTLPHFRPPRELTKDEIKAVVQQHADAARRAIRAGFDGTEITSFMGYLLANFNSPFTNQRTDEYGGSVQNRGRFMRELIDAIKQATPDNPLSVRLNGAELMDRWGGNSEDESFELMQQAVDCGVDMISVTVGWQEAPESSFGRDVQPGYWNYLSAKAKKMFPNVLVAFGNRLPDPAMADECIRDGVFDYWEVCRPLLADPELIHKAAEDRMEEVRPCIGSLNCLSRLFRDLPYTCTMNPMLGHEFEPEYHITRPPSRSASWSSAPARPAWRRPSRRASAATPSRSRQGRQDRRQPRRLCRQRPRPPRRPAERHRLLRRDGEEARRRGATQHRGRRQVHAQRAARLRRLHRRRRRPHRHGGVPVPRRFTSCWSTRWKSPTATSRPASAW